MKKNLLLVIIVQINICAYAQAPAYLWANSSAGGSARVSTSSVATDLNSNIIVAGNFNLGSILIGSTTLTNPYTNNTSDIYIAKYDASGNVMWAKSVGGNEGDIVSAIATDANDNIIVAGYFNSPSITFGSITLTSVGEEDIFLAKYDASGNVLWAKSAGSAKSDRATSVATNSNGNIIIAGYFNSLSITFGSNTLTNIGTTVSDDIFLANYDASGNVLWAKCAGGSAFEQPWAVTSDDNGNILITGYFNSANITFGSTTLTNPGYASNYGEIFLVKYDASGNVLWAKNAVGGSSDFAYAVSTDVNGNIFVAGTFKSPSINFGSTTLTNTSGNFDLFLAKYNASGNIVWAKSAGGSDADYAYSLSVLANGNIVMAGSFRSNTITLGSSTFTNSGSENTLLVNYDVSGNVIWAKSEGGSSVDRAISVVTDANSNIIVAGDFWSPNITFGSTTFASPGYGGDMFVAKLNDATFVNEWNNEAKISIYPNPTNGMFNFQTTPSLDFQMISIEIYNLFGENIFQSVINKQKSQVDLTSQPNGVYFVFMKTDQGTFVQKLLIQK